MKAGRLAVLDAARFLAALLVVAYHYMAISSPAWGKTLPTSIFPRSHYVTQYGWMGVELFFLISGFVICMSAWGRSLAQFAVSRVVRLYPAYWFAIVATTVVLMLWPNKDIARPTLADTAINLTMFENGLGVQSVDAVYWSLWYELLFYALFAIVVWRGLTYRRAVGFCALWLLVSTIAVGGGSDLAKSVLIPDTAPFFIGGIAFYLIRRFGSNIILWGIVAASYLFGLRPVLATTETASELTGQDVPKWGTSLVLALFYLLMALIACGALDRITWRGFTVLGTMTYPLYLLHEFIGWTMLAGIGRRIDPWASLGLTVGVMLVAAWLVHRLIERPLSALLKPALTKAVAQVKASGKTALAERD